MIGLIGRDHGGWDRKRDTRGGENKIGAPEN